ncbi:multicopper oxidase domain-containing protein [Nitrosococcus wardiae]|uniref:multicopper oxidase domain-containing protein n=1 Tax=Nitrosococcus wardiae TaxID=1814290 RepID=UPI001F0F5547|nr:multicopper oxidase domain-containing protein [Nitrosococcus wardiae]
MNRDRRARGMMMPHPMHIHGQPFQIVKREVLPGFQQGYASLNEGFITSGWRDTVLVMPGEKVTLLKPFEDYEGLFLYHCHNMEHEDLDMMRNFQVRA